MNQGLNASDKDVYVCTILCNHFNSNSDINTNFQKKSVHQYELNSKVGVKNKIIFLKMDVISRNNHQRIKRAIFKNFAKFTRTPVSESSFQ